MNRVTQCLHVGLSCVLFMVHILTIETIKSRFLLLDSWFLELLSCFVIVIIWIPYLLEKTFFLTLNKVDLGIIGCFVYIIIHSIFVGTHSIRDDFSLFALLVLYFYCKYFLNNDYCRLCVVFIIALLLVSLYCLSAITFVPSLLYQNVSYRSFSAFNGNFFSVVLPFSISVFIYLLNLSDSRFLLVGRLCTILLVFLVFYLLARSGSRTSFVGATTGLLFFVYKLSNSRVNKIRLKVIGGVILLSLIPFLLSLNVNSVFGRMFIYKVSFYILGDKPFGLGLGMFQVKYNLYQADYLANHNVVWGIKVLANNSYYAFNEYIQFLVEQGVASVVFIILAILFLLKRAHREKEIIKIGALSSLIVLLVNSLTSFPMHVSSVQVVALLFVSIISADTSNTIRFKVKGLYLLIIAFFLSFATHCEYLIYMGLKHWENGFYYTLVGEDKHAKDEYKYGYHLLGSNGEFLYNFGLLYLRDNDYKKSLYLFNRAVSSYSSDELYLNRGYCYHMLKNYKLAEANYLKSSYIVPHRFLPKYYLLLLYIELDDKIKIKEVATAIVHQEVKIPSKTTSDIKEFAEKYIKTNYN